MYMPGRLRTASSPRSTEMEEASFAGLAERAQCFQVSDARVHPVEMPR